jgi:integrase
MPRKATRNPLGSIFKRQVYKEGKQITVYDARKCYAVIGPDGKKTYKAKSQRCYSYAEALTALGNLPAEIAENERTTSTVDRTFFELVKYFKKEYCKPAVFSGDRQISGYRQNYKNIETYLDEYKAFFGDVPLDQLTFEDIRAYAEHVATTPIRHANARNPPTRLPAPATVNRKLAYLRRMLNVGKRLRWLAVNPFQDGEALIKLSNEKPRDRVLTFAEETRLLAACTGPRLHLRLIVILALDTGLRKKELFSLERRDIDLNERLITITARRTKALKTRKIVISDRLDAELRKHFARFNFHPNAPIFFGQKDADRAFETALRTAKIKDFTFHDLRHTATTWMDEAGISSTAKQAMIGVTSGRDGSRYHNPSADVFESARDKMNALRRSK